MRFATLVLGTALLWAAPAQAADPASEALDYGKELYFAGQYGEALFALEELALDTAASLAARVLALKYAAYCYFVLGSKEQARDAWLRLLALDPEFRMDPVEVSPEFVEFFAKLAPQASATPQGDPPSTESAGASPETPRVSTRGCGVWLCLVPMGVGQYANRKIGKGLIFTALEIVSLGLNAGFYWSLRLEREQYGGYRDQATADRLYALQHAFFGLFVASTLVGMIDAFVFYD